MNKKFVIFSVAKLLEILAIILFIPAVIAAGEISLENFPSFLFNPKLSGFLIAIVTSFLFGQGLKLFGSNQLKGNGIREGFAIVTFGWLTLTLFGSIPLLVYFLSQSQALTADIIIHSFTDAYFEIMSGFTTTGATILTDIESFPRGILFWRSLTHWLGGMGIITLALAILPAFGIASYQMFKGEIPGPSAERLKPRLPQTAKILWGAYVMLTFLETTFLMLGGMSLFDALCHSFGTMATGGFSTKNASLAAYQSPYIQWVVIVFMFFAGMNFIIHYRILFKRKLDLVKNNREFHFYSTVILLAILVTFLILTFKGIGTETEITRSFRYQPLSQTQLAETVAAETARIRSPLATLRHSAFQVISLTTTTGYATADFDVWPTFIRYMLVILMFFGGCAGSTGGGIKMVRIMVIVKTAWREVKALIHPRIVLPLKIAQKPVEEKQVANIVGFVVLFLALFVLLSLIMAFILQDFITAITAVVSTICNIGPGLSGVGATENYAWIPLAGKWILTASMLLGRLEIYTVLIAFAPSSWKR